MSDSDASTVPPPSLDEDNLAGVSHSPACTAGPRLAWIISQEEPCQAKANFPGGSNWGTEHSRRAVDTNGQEDGFSTKARNEIKASSVKIRLDPIAACAEKAPGKHVHRKMTSPVCHDGESPTTYPCRGSSSSPRGEPSLPEVPKVLAEDQPKQAALLEEVSSRTAHLESGNVCPSQPRRAQKAAHTTPSHLANKDMRKGAPQGRKPKTQNKGQHASKRQKSLKSTTRARKKSRGNIGQSPSLIKEQLLPGISAIFEQVSAPTPEMYGSREAYIMEEAYSFSHSAASVPSFEEIEKGTSEIRSIELLQKLARKTRRSPSVSFEDYTNSARTSIFACGEEAMASVPVQLLSRNDRSISTSGLRIQIEKLEREVINLRAQLVMEQNSGPCLFSDDAKNVMGSYRVLTLDGTKSDNATVLCNLASVMCSRIPAGLSQTSLRSLMTVGDIQQFLNCCRRAFDFIQGHLSLKRSKSARRAVVHVFRNVILKILESMYHNSVAGERCDTSTFEVLFTFVLGQIDAIYERMLSVKAEVDVSWSWTVSFEIVGSMERAFSTLSPSFCQILTKRLVVNLQTIGKTMQMGEEFPDKVSVEVISNSMEVAMTLVMSSHKAAISLPQCDLLHIGRHNMLISEYVFSLASFDSSAEHASP